ncbi:DUF4913 domain-containing protein [Nocardia nova]|uniref:DUF4913 domain-containing protein n=1 Tax=Nocardia nova TaxID=37330 RepID=UPI001C45CCC2|nr:DUF4913 domain-containing protein [Nocardia nova]MBV7708203.1 DUF4913 domain-containing protein [Nocardia nova]
MTTTTPTNGAGPADAAATNSSAAAAGSAAAQFIPAAELGELMDAVVRKAVGAKFAETARDIAAEVVEKLLTPEIREQMAETAAHEAELALNPPVVTPEPEPEPVAAAEAEPELKYPDVETFVEKYVAHVFRREVSMQGTENKIRWCRDWYLHGEVHARFEALWMAFEALRQGPGPEQSSFWLNHFSPMMREIFDPEGPFKYCTVSGGHRDKLVPLPWNPAPRAGASQAGQFSGIVVPTGPTVHHQHIIRPEFP